MEQSEPRKLGWSFAAVSVTASFQFTWAAASDFGQALALKDIVILAQFGVLHALDTTYGM